MGRDTNKTKEDYIKYSFDSFYPFSFLNRGFIL